MPHIRTPDNTARRYLFGQSMTAISKAVGWSRDTAYRRREKPGNITLDELAVLVAANEVTQEELYKLVTERS